MLVYVFLDGQSSIQVLLHFYAQTTAASAATSDTSQASDTSLWQMATPNAHSNGQLLSTETTAASAGL